MTITIQQSMRSSQQNYFCLHQQDLSILQFIINILIMYNGQSRDHVYLNLPTNFNRDGSYHHYKQEYLGKIAKNNPIPHPTIRQQPEVELKPRQMQDRPRISKNSQNEYRTALYDQSNRAADMNKQPNTSYNEKANSPERTRYSRGNRYSNENIINYEEGNYTYGRLQRRQYIQETKNTQSRKYDQYPDRQATKNNKYREYDQKVGKSTSVRQLDRSHRLNSEFQTNERFSRRNEVPHKNHYSISDKHQIQNQEHTQNNYDDQGIVYSHNNTPIRTQKNSKLSKTPDSVVKSKERRQNLINRSIQLKERMNELSSRSVSKKGHREITNSEFDVKSNTEKTQDRESNLKVNRQLDSQKRLEKLRGEPEQRVVDSPYRQQQSGLRSYKRYSREILEDNQNQGQNRYQNQIKKIDLYTKETVKPLKQQKTQERYPLREQRREVRREDNKQEKRYGQREEKRQYEGSTWEQKASAKQGDCMSRITMLNKKINERINSIINNFGSPS